MGDESTCICCPVYRADATPRIPHNPPVCDGDRTLLDRHLADIARLDEELRNDEGPIVDDRQHERFGTAYFEGNRRHVFSKGLRPSDPLSALGGVAPINSRSKQPDVSGSRERAIPIRVDEMDLKAPARQPNPTVQARDWPEDQIGRLSAATVLDQWVRDVREALFPDHRLPPATVADLVGWLRHRVDDICDRHPAVDEFAAEMRDLRGALRGVAGETDPPPERCEGVACKRCNMQMLFRQSDSDVHCMNVNCTAVYREEEYQDWVKTLAAEQKVKRHAQPENAAALQG